MSGTLARFVNAGLLIAERLEWLPPLLVRLFVGYFFFETGWGKIHDLDAFAERFVGWGIPFPHFNAALSAYTELAGGALTVVGLAMRAVSIPMMVNMLVAIATVKLKTVSGLDDFVELDEPLYLLSFLWLMIAGPGAVSLDHLLGRALGLPGWASNLARDARYSRRSPQHSPGGT